MQCTNKLTPRADLPETGSDSGTLIEPSLSHPSEETECHMKVTISEGLKRQEKKKKKMI